MKFEPLWSGELSVVLHELICDSVQQCDTPVGFGPAGTGAGAGLSILFQGGGAGGNSTLFCSDSSA